MALEVNEQEYKDLLNEVDNVSGQLTKTRETLWQTQDTLREKESKIRELEMHVTELVATHEADAEQIKQIQEQNTKCLEEEMKVRESLDLMKKVFTRNQLKAKEEQETLMLLQEERDLLLEENGQLRSRVSQAKADDDTISNLQKEGKDKEAQLKELAEKAVKELEQYKKMHVIAEKNIKSLTQQLLAQKESPDAAKQVAKQRLKIDRMERLIYDMQKKEMQKEEQETMDEKDEEADLLKRALFDEDLEDGLARTFMQTMDCTSFNDDLAARAYPLFGLGTTPDDSP